MEIEGIRKRTALKAVRSGYVTVFNLAVRLRSGSQQTGEVTIRSRIHTRHSNDFTILEPEHWSNERVRLTIPE